jgi:hypothetical protein
MGHGFFDAALDRPLGHALDVTTRAERPSGREHNGPNGYILRQRGARASTR